MALVLVGLLSLQVLAAQAPAAPPTTKTVSGGSGFTLEVLPDLYIPLGTDADYFGLGFGSSLSAAWKPLSLPFLSLGFGALYSYMPTKAPGLSLSSAALTAHAGFRFQLSRNLSLSLRGEGGWFGAVQNGSSASPEYNPYYSGGAFLGLELSRSLTVEASASWRSWYGLASGLGVNLGLNVALGGGGPGGTRLPAGFLAIANQGRGLAFSGVRLDSVFPVFYKHYDDHPIGRVIVRNFETAAVTDIKATVLVKRYMDEAKPAGVPVRVAPGATGELLLYGLFTDSILDVVEATKLPVTVSLQYTQYGKTYTDEYVGTLDVLDRNAITWDDDRKAAAFISSKDPEALAWSKGVAGAVKDLLNPGVNQNLQAAMAVHEALRLQKYAYVKDPTSALETNNKQVVDFIQFPRQTLGFRSGKCSDLTVLYCSLLEGVGVPTALITTPGHILMAIDLEMDPAEALKTFSRPDDIIIRDGRAWLPIETTDRSGDFMTAWQEGASEWREATAKKVAGFVPVRDAWKEYQPVVYQVAGATVQRPTASAAASAFKAELSAYVTAELGLRVASIQAEIRKSGGSPALYNKLGVLYARYGQTDKAEEQFALAIKAGKGNQPALYNMGNVLFLRGRYTDALSYYSKVLASAPTSAQALLAMSRSYAALGKFTDALAYYDKLRKADSTLAARYAWLGAGAGDGTRAVEVEKQKGVVSWQD
jgi:hypothetical protein